LAGALLGKHVDEKVVHVIESAHYIGETRKEISETGHAEIERGRKY